MVLFLSKDSLVVSS